MKLKLILGLFLLSFPMSALAGYGTHLACLQSCDPTFKQTLSGYNVENACTKCCDNTFGHKYTDCKILYSQCRSICKQRNHYQNTNLDCKEVCSNKKEDCEQAHEKEKTAFSCTTD